MANAIPDAHELASLPLFFGNSMNNTYPKGFVTPEHFLSRMIKYVASLNLPAGNDALKIAKIVNQFRGDAQTWWEGVVLSRRYPTPYDKERTQDTYEVFLATFRYEWFRVASYIDTAEDISDLSMKPNETAREYFRRVRVLRTDMDNTIQDHVETLFTNDELRTTFAPATT